MNRFCCLFAVLIFSLVVHANAFADSVNLPESLNNIEEEAFFHDRWYTVVSKTRARPGKEKDMIAVRLSLSWKQHMEQLQSRFIDLDRHSTRSYKAKKNRIVMS